jgi:hypothetical protein
MDVIPSSPSASLMEILPMVHLANKHSQFHLSVTSWTSPNSFPLIQHREVHWLAHLCTMGRFFQRPISPASAAVKTSLGSRGSAAVPHPDISTSFLTFKPEIHSTLLHLRQAVISPLFPVRSKRVKKKRGGGGRCGHAPYQDLAQRARTLAVDELLGVVQLHVHVCVDADQPAAVLGRAPFEPHYYVFVYPACPAPARASLSACSVSFRSGLFLFRRARGAWGALGLACGAERRGRRRE